MNETADQIDGEEDDGLLHGGKAMPLLEHLGELRDRLVKCAIFVLILFFIGVYPPVSKILIDFLSGPLISVLPENANVLHFTGPMDVFIAGVKISIISALVLSCPIWLWHLWRFIEPALYPHERKYIFPFIVASTLLFTAGVTFSFVVILPLALEFLIGLGTASATAIITINDYISMLMLFIFGFGLAFETPLIIILLAMLDLVSADFLAEYRKLVMVGILVMGALLTPPDPISQLALAVPLYLMYEISILIIRMIKGKSEGQGQTA